MLNENNFNYLGHATLDHIGRVFEYQGCIYRGIYKEKVDFVRELFEVGLIQELINQNLLVSTEITDLSSINYPLIIRHERITPTTPLEWTFSMLKDAAHTIKKVNEICNKFGYELLDAHPFNILFKKNSPVWVDLGSIAKLENLLVWRAKDEFIDFTLFPLYLFNKHKLFEAYSILLMTKYFQLSSRDFRNNELYKIFTTEYPLDGEVRASMRSEDLLLEKITQSENVSTSIWSDYQELDKIEDYLKGENAQFSRFMKVADLVNKFSSDATSTLDLAGNLGLTLIILQKECPSLKDLINTDYDYNIIEKSYRFLRSKDLGIETYVLNFMLPMNEGIPKGLKSDLVLGLAVTHHLLITQGHKIDEIFRRIGDLSRKYVYIEFMPLGLWGGDPNSKPEVPDWYNEGFFDDAFSKHFNKLHREVLESHVINGVEEPHRVLYIGTIKND